MRGSHTAKGFCMPDTIRCMLYAVSLYPIFPRITRSHWSAAACTCVCACRARPGRRCLHGISFPVCHDVLSMIPSPLHRTIVSPPWQMSKKNVLFSEILVLRLRQSLHTRFPQHLMRQKKTTFPGATVNTLVALAFLPLVPFFLRHAICLLANATLDNSSLFQTYRHVARASSFQKIPPF